jgi:hypothetical protein
MTDQMPNAPMMSGGSASIFQTWINALTKPNEQTFSEIAASPSAKATTAYIWVFISSFVVNFITFIVRGAVIRDQLAQNGFGADRLGGGVVGALIGLICIAPILAVVQTLFFAVDVAIIQWIAKMFGGKGTFDQMAYTFASISVPFSIIIGVVSIISLIPFVIFCFWIIFFIGILYIIVLELMAIKAVNQFGWGPAIGSLFIPILAVSLVCCCIGAVFSTVMGPIIGNVFSTINQSLNP